MPTTTNFGWTTPADTDLVKDGAAAIRTFAGNVDTSLVDLKGGTSGQYLTKNSNTDLDYAWVTLSAGGMTLISTTTLTGASVTLSTIPSGYNSLQLRILNYIPATDNTKLSMRINSDSNTRYSWAVGANVANETFVSFDYIEVSNGNDNAVGYGLNIIDIPDYASTNRWKTGEAYGVNTNATTTANFNTNNYRFYYNQLAAITSLDLFPASGNFTSGTALLYGVK